MIPRSPAAPGAEPGIDGLAEAIVAAMPRLDASEREVAIALYRSLAGGRPIRPDDLAHRAALPAAYVADMLARWPGVFRDKAGAVVGFWGLAIPEMPHRVEVDGVGLYTWCAWDPLFIAPVLGKRARVTSHFVPGDADRAVWSLPVTVRRTPEGAPDFGGPFVHGRRGDRFLCLNWGSVTEEFRMFRRARLRFADCDPRALQAALQSGALICRVRMTDPCGNPV